MRLAVIALLLTGCAHRGGGLNFPGPLARMGDEPLPYVERLQEAEDDEEERVTASPTQRAGTRAPRRDGDGGLVARSADRLVGSRKLVVDGEHYRWDCSGFVMAAYARAGIDVSGSSRDMFDLARETGVLHHKKRPSPGDVAFFDNSYDRNGNGRRDDELTHVAIVETVDEDGTITLIHLGSQGVGRILMNLKHPSDRYDEEGELINSYLRAARHRDEGEVLTGELWRAFGSLWATDGAGVADTEDTEVR